jgi:hypothetical protein
MAGRKPAPLERDVPVPGPFEGEADRRRQRDGLLAAFLLALFLHLLLYWGSPGQLFDSPDRPDSPPQTVEVILEPIPEEPELEETYVRAAPNIAENTPEETRNISDRDQRAAQEEQAPPDPDNTPYVEGDEPESNRIVQGNPMQQPTPNSPPAASPTQGASPMVQQEAAPREQPAETRPDLLDQEPEAETGLASIPNPDREREEPEEPVPAEAEPVQETSPLDGQGQARITTPPQAGGEEGPRPRPRQRVERDTSFGPVKDNRQGAIQIGRLAFDAQYSEFGEYWRRVAEIIEARWRNLVYNTRSIPFGGYRVVVQFAITRQGQVRDVEVEFSDAGKLAETISVDAIVGEAPFFDWTPEMIIRMGEQAEAAIHFYY